MISTNPIRFLSEANKISQIVSTCCRVAVTDLGTAKHRGNNQACSPEVSPLSSNPCETRCAAPEEMNNHSARSQHSHRGRVSRSHTSSLSVYYMSGRGHSEKRKEAKIKKNVKKLDQRFRGGHALLDWGRLGFVVAVRMRDRRRQRRRSGRLFIFRRWSAADRHSKGLCTYPNSPL